MTVWIICLTLWYGGASIERAVGREYDSEADCLRARSTMDFRHGVAECKPAKEQGT